MLKTVYKLYIQHYQQLHHETDNVGHHTTEKYGMYAQSLYITQTCKSSKHFRITRITLPPSLPEVETLDMLNTILPVHVAFCLDAP